MLLIDKRATETSKSSLFLTREEFKGIYPHRLNSRLNYIFYHSKPKEINDKEAKLLLKKYLHLLKWEEQLKINETARHAELKKLIYGDLKKMASDVGLTFKEMQCKAPLLIDRIVAKEISNKQLKEQGTDK